MADELFCPEHPNTALFTDEDTGNPTCWVCVTLRAAELADSWGIIGSDGQHREVSKAEFMEHAQAQACEEKVDGWRVLAYKDAAGVRVTSTRRQAAAPPRRSRLDHQPSEGAMKQSPPTTGKEATAMPARRQLHVSSALTRPFCYREGVVASRSLLPIWQTQGGHHGKDGQR